MNKVAEQLGGMILGSKKGDRFSFTFWGVNIKLQIPIQETWQVVKCGQIEARMEDVDMDGQMYPELMRVHKNLNLICKYVAVGTGSKIPFLWWIIKRSLTGEDLQKLTKLIQINTDPERFFFIMASLRGMNRLRSKSEVETPSPGPSQ